MTAVFGSVLGAGALYGGYNKIVKPRLKPTSNLTSVSGVTQTVKEHPYLAAGAALVGTGLLASGVSKIAGKGWLCGMGGKKDGEKKPAHDPDRKTKFFAGRDAAHEGNQEDDDPGNTKHIVKDVEPDDTYLYKEVQEQNQFDYDGMLRALNTKINLDEIIEKRQFEPKSKGACNLVTAPHAWDDC